LRANSSGASQVSASWMQATRRCGFSRIGCFRRGSLRWCCRISLATGWKCSWRKAYA